MKKIIFILWLSFSVFSLGVAQKLAELSIPETIAQAIKAGDAAQLARSFNANIELIILDKESIYSRAQAELIMKNFFNRNKPTSFKIIHEGGMTSSKFAIGRLSSSGGIYRVTFFYKEVNKNALIHQLRIEPNEE